MDQNIEALLTGTFDGQQCIAGRLGSHRAVAQDEMGQHGEYRLAPRTLNAPNDQTAEPNAGIMRVAGQTAAVTGRFVDELKTDRVEEACG